MTDDNRGTDGLAVKRFYINGRFLGQPVSGVQRYGRELIAALDAILSTQRQPAEAWSIVVPEPVADGLSYRNIAVKVLPSRLSGHLWEQGPLAFATRDGVLINLTNTGAVWRRNQISVIHDMSVYRNPEYFSRTYGRWHRLLGRCLARQAQLVTVSAFSRGEMADIFRMDPADIPIIRNGCDHMLDTPETFDAHERLGLAQSPYFVVLGNQNRNKNVAAAIAAIGHVPQARLVIIGGARNHVFGSSERHDDGAGRVHYAGRLDDSEVGGLLRKSAGLVFPSFYEGFGIPPLEALAKDCPVLASDIPPVREVCGDAAVYFDPHDPLALAERMRETLGESPDARRERLRRGRERLGNLRWSTSAAALLETCRAQAGTAA